MAHKFNFKSGSTLTRDSRLSARIGQRLRFVSEKQQRERIKEQRAGKVKVSLEFNRSGNLRGMNMRENPPSSEEMQRRRAMRRMYNKQMPVLQCSQCAFQSQCHQFKAGFECAFLPMLNSHRVETVEDLLVEMKNMAETAVRRAHVQTMMETMTGGMPTLETTEALGIAFNQLKAVHDTMTDAGKVSMSIESDDGSIISKIFGDLGSLIQETSDQRDNPINVMRPLAVDAIECKADDKEVVTELVNSHTKDELLRFGRPNSKTKEDELSKMLEVSVSELRK